MMLIALLSLSVWELGLINFTNVLWRWKALYALLDSWWQTITLAGKLMAQPLNKEKETLLKYRKVINNAFGGSTWVVLSGKEEGMQLSFCPW